MLKTGINFIHEGQNVLRIVPSNKMAAALAGVAATPYARLNTSTYRDMDAAFVEVQQITISGEGDLPAAVARFHEASDKFYGAAQ